MLRKEIWEREVKVIREQELGIIYIHDVGKWYCYIHREADSNTEVIKLQALNFVACQDSGECVRVGDEGDRWLRMVKLLKEFAPSIRIGA